MDVQEQPLKLMNILYCVHYNQIIVLRGLDNKSECIQLIFDIKYWLQRH